MARVLVDLGHDVSVSGFLGADNDGPFLRAFETLGVEDVFIRVPGETRINAKLAEADGRVTDINGPGAAIDAEAWQKLLEGLDARVHDPLRRPDALVAAMLHGVLSGHPPEQVLRLATALSAESVRHVGVGNARAADFPTLQQQTRVRRLNDVDAGGAIA